MSFMGTGASGGAVIGSDGCMVGLVTSNARHSKANRSLPNLNFSLPVEALQPLWRLLLGEASLHIGELQKLDVNNEALTSMWALSDQTPGIQADRGGAAHLQQLLQQKGIMRSIQTERSQPILSRL